jgi:hypothetical protein
MEDWYDLAITLEHRVPLNHEDDNESVIQHYRSKILVSRDEKQTVAGSFDFYVVNVALAVNNGIDIVDAADAVDQDLSNYCETIFEPETAGGYREDVVEQFDYPSGSRVLILHLAKVLPEFRGMRLGLVSAHKVIEHYGDGFVIAMAQPLQHREGYARDKSMRYETFEPDKAKALKQLTRHWQRLGFEPIGDSGYLGLNTANKLPVPKLRTSTPAKNRPKQRRSKK